MEKRNGIQTSEEREYYRLVRKVFGLLAPFYDISGLVLSRVRAKVVDFTSARSGSRILDNATGTGKQAMAFAEKGYDVVGADLSEAMLHVAVKKNQSEKAQFLAADAASLPFKDGAFDVACVSFGLHEMPFTVIRKAMAETARVTRKDGQILVVDYALPSNRLAAFLVYHFVRLYEGKYYSEFIKLNLNELLREFGIGVTGELPAVLGAARIWKATKMS